MTIMSEFLIDLGVRIKQARLHAKMTQLELGEALSVSPQRISHWESGDVNISVHQLALIADATDRPTWMLIPDLED